MKIPTWIVKIFQRKKPQPSPYTVVKITEVNGQSVYGFENPIMLPSVRRVALFEAVHDAGLGVNRDDLEKFILLMRESANNKDFATIAQTLGMLEAYIDLHANSKNIFRVASLLFMLDGENPDKLEAEPMKRKEWLFDNDTEFRSFFLQRGYALLMSFSSSSIGHIRIEDYLKQDNVKLTERLFLKLVIQNTAIATAKSSI